ncbi:MAG TPA: pyridoxal phosphate-dependent aminotransferase [Desulfosporosinus sp.]|nr:pyridoxal phosphate-dependent aminotransferase [Desulfosporosinus sp.]
MIQLSQSANRLEGQPMFRLLEKVNKRIADGEDIIHFEIGDPDFDTPQNILKASISSMMKGDTHYTASSGDIKLKQAIIDYTNTDLGFSPSVDQIVISPGSNCLIHAIIKCLVDEDEEVILPDPSFPTYYSVLKLLNIIGVPVPLREINEFRMNPRDIQDRITTKTKLIILNSPQNPTGSVIKHSEIQEIYDIAAKHHIFILSDEIYRLMSYDDAVSSPCVYDHCKDTTIMMTGFSKAFAMSGWRLGYMVGPVEIAEKVSLLLQTTVSCTNSFVQKAGIEALTLNDARREHLEKMMAELRQRRFLMVEGLNAIDGISCVTPKGAFYVFANITKTKLDSQQFADLMLENGVALLPGPNFGKYCEGYVRLCYCTSTDNITEGLKRIGNALR